MIQAVRLLFIVFRGLIFEHKDEYNIKSPGFKPKKMLTFILIVLSFLANILLFARLYDIVGDCANVKETVEKTEESKAVKKPTLPPSDS